MFAKLSCSSFGVLFQIKMKSTECNVHSSTYSQSVADGQAGITGSYVILLKDGKQRGAQYNESAREF